MKEQIANKIINSSHGKLVTDRGFKEAILKGLEEYKESLILTEKLPEEQKSRIYFKAYRTGMRATIKKFRATYNQCKTLNYDKDRIIQEFAKIMKYW